MLSNQDRSKKKRAKETWLWIIIGGIFSIVIVAVILILHKSDSQTNRLYSAIHSVFVSGNDIYAVGSTCTRTSETDVPTLWKNGVAQEIGNMGNFNKATSVFVSGNDVYITIDESDKGQALLWKNGESQLLAEGIGDAEANCVYVYGNDVYVAGQKDGQPTLWKNGIPNSLGESGSATSVVVKGDNIFVAGYNGDSFSSEAFLYLLRGIEVTAFNLEMEKVNSIFVTNYGELYVAGVANNAPALWKDGEFWPLENYGKGSAESVAVNDSSDVVVTGITLNPNSNAVVWVNGKRTQVDDIFGYQAMSVTTDGNSFFIGGCAKDGRWAVYKYDGIAPLNLNNLQRIK